MTTATPDVCLRALRRAVDHAVRAPSVHNTQPWRFTVLPDALEIYADRTRQLPVLDPSGRELYLSLGCALFNAEVSLAHSGLAFEVHRFPVPDEPEFVARVVLAEGEPDPRLAALEPQLLKRQTNRRHFADDPVPEEFVTGLVELAAEYGTQLVQVLNEDQRLAVAILTQGADAAQIANPAYRAEVRTWTTADPDRRDGVRALSVPKVDGTSGDELPIRDFDSQGAGFLPAQTASSHNQCLLIFATYADDRDAWLRTGEALERVWLELTRSGYAASLFTQPIETAAFRQELRQELAMMAHPHVLMRIGHAPITPPSLRRPVGDVLGDSD
jgi:nitroreductase